MEAQTNEEKLQQAVAALEKIAFPFRYFQIEAEKTGAKLNGQMAIRLADDPNWLRNIAEQALKEIV